MQHNVYHGERAARRAFIDQMHTLIHISGSQYAAMIAAERIEALDEAEEAAWEVLMGSSPDDACSIRGQEGKNYLAWCAAADACYLARQAELDA